MGKLGHMFWEAGQLDELFSVKKRQTEAVGS